MAAGALRSVAFLARFVSVLGRSERRKWPLFYQSAADSALAWNCHPGRQGTTWNQSLPCLGLASRCCAAGKEPPWLGFPQKGISAKPGAGGGLVPSPGANIAHQELWGSVGPSGEAVATPLWGRRGSHPFCFLLFAACLSDAALEVEGAAMERRDGGHALYPHVPLAEHCLDPPGIVRQTGLQWGARSRH